jgi:hypothetical protein
MIFRNGPYGWVFQPPATEGFVKEPGSSVKGRLAVSQGRNEDKWSKVQPWDQRETEIILW